MTEKYIDIKVRTGNSKPEVDALDSKMRNLGSTTDRTAQMNTKLTKSAAGVQKGLARMSHGAGQVGIQIQQLVGQIQGGQNAAQAFAAQAADIGIVMGAPLIGVLAAFGFAIGGPLISSLGLGTSAIKDLDKATEALKETVEQTDSGVVVFTESIQRLAEKSEAAARIELALGLTKTKEAIKAAKKEIDEATESWESWLAINENTDNAVAGLAALEKAAKQMGVTQVEALNQLGETYKGTILGIGDLNDATEDLSKKFGLTTGESLKFFKAVAEFRKTKSVESMQQLSATMSDLAVNVEKPNAKLIQLASRISKASLSASDAAEAQKLFTEALKDFNPDDVNQKTKDFSASIESLTVSLNSQFIALGQGEEAAFRYAVAQQLGLATTEEIPAAIDAQIAALFKLKQAQEDAAKLKKTESATAKSTAFAATLALEAEQLRAGLALKQAITDGFLSTEEAKEVERYSNEALRSQARFDAEILKLGEDEIAKEELREQYRLLQIEKALAFEQTITDIKGKAAEDRLKIESEYSESITKMQQSVFLNAAGLLSQLTGNQKIAAVAAIAVQTKTALVANEVATASAATLAYASQLIPGDPTSPARGLAAAAQATALGKANGALIIASGIASAAGAVSGGGGGGLGTAGDTGFHASTPSNLLPQQNQQNRVINITGLDGFGDDQPIPLTVGGLRDLLSSNEDVNIAINTGQQSAQRVGAI